MTEHTFSTKSAPRIRKHRRVLHRTGRRTRTVGWHGPTTRGVRGFVTARDSHEHRIRALNAYAISQKVLDKLRDRNVELILVAETDTGKVLEYSPFDFSNSVPSEYLSDKRDPQSYAETNDATVWPDHHGDVYVPRSEDL